MKSSSSSSPGTYVYSVIALTPSAAATRRIRQRVEALRRPRPRSPRARSRRWEKRWRGPRRGASPSPHSSAMAEVTPYSV